MAVPLAPPLELAWWLVDATLTLVVCASVLLIPACVGVLGCRLLRTRLSPRMFYYTANVTLCLVAVPVMWRAVQLLWSGTDLISLSTVNYIVVDDFASLEEPSDSHEVMSLPAVVLRLKIPKLVLFLSTILLLTVICVILRCSDRLLVVTGIEITEWCLVQMQVGTDHMYVPGQRHPIMCMQDFLKHHSQLHAVLMEQHYINQALCEEVSRLQGEVLHNRQGPKKRAHSRRHKKRPHNMMFT